jgi:hypothetical protein
MKKIILLALVLGGGWWYFVGGRQLSDDRVNGFYQQWERATLERKPQDLCDLLADDFESQGTMVVGGRAQSTGPQNKELTCEAYRGLYDTWEKLGEKMGGLLQLDSQYTVHSIVLSADRKTATVDFSSSLDVGGSIMNIRSRSTDTLVRRNGKVLMLRSQGQGSIGNR